MATQSLDINLLTLPKTAHGKGGLQKRTQRATCSHGAYAVDHGSLLVQSCIPTLTKNCPATYTS
eukprot:8725921-Pyramimonas_sp.AAC.1